MAYSFLKFQSNGNFLGSFYNEHLEESYFSRTPHVLTFDNVSNFVRTVLQHTVFANSPSQGMVG